MINFNWWGWLFGLLVTGAILFIPLDYFVFPNLRQRYYSYRLNEEEIEIQKGNVRCKTRAHSDDSCAARND